MKVEIGFPGFQALVVVVDSPAITFPFGTESWAHLSTIGRLYRFENKGVNDPTRLRGWVVDEL